MRIIILKNNLKEALDATGRSVSETSNLPILKNILLKAEDNKIHLSSTNLELGITHFLSGKIVENGRLSIPSSIFSTIINNLTSERINLEKKDYNLLIKTDNYEAVIQGLNPEDFPIIPKIDSSRKFIKMDSGLFKDSLSKVLSASQFSELRPEINGILFNYQIDSLKFAATDSFRLAEKTIDKNHFESSFQNNVEAIIPLKTAQELVRIIKDNQEISVFIDPNQILFKTENQEIISRLMDSHFPNYQPIIPREFSTEIVFSREELINSLKLAGAFAGRVNNVKIKTGDNGKNMEIYSADTAIGENRMLLPVKLSGKPIDISFNWKYLMDGLKTYGSEEVVMSFNGDSKPAIIKNSQDKSYFYVLMPVKN